MYSSAFSLPKKEAERLKNWKNPTKQPLGAPVGEFTSVLVSILMNRCVAESKVNLKEVNTFLDTLSSSEDKTKIFEEFV